MRTLLVLILFFQVLTPAAHGSPDVWEVVSDHDFPPYNYFEGKDWAGLDTEIVKAILAEMRVQARFNPMPWKRAEIELKAGTADLGYQLVFTEEREKSLELVGPFRYGDTVFAVPSDSRILRYQHIRDFQGLRMGAIRGFAYTPEFDRFTDFTVQLATTNEQLVLLLASKRIDVAIFDSRSLAFWVKKTGMQGKVRVLPNVYSRVARYLGLPKGRKSEATRVKSALRKLQRNGKIDQLIKLWNLRH